MSDGKLKVKLEKGAFPPAKAHADDAGYDLRTPIDFVLMYGQSMVIDTGVHMAIKPGWFGKIESKSGLMVRYRILAPGGVIDSGYRGSVKVLLENRGKETLRFEAGQKITQIIFIPCGDFEIEIVDELDETERGDGGFGSTGR